MFYHMNNILLRNEFFGLPKKVTIIIYTEDAVYSAQNLFLMKAIT
ncbi:hypothetical protein XM38_038460 [Halomicronema hongdechloris C2206]|uniref:Uncharacterized protein n=1 Tax=Halomicronema hongdechloris C2206 TaxID=1641165 RepID=A0A1Z3HRK9_9CYAN|nr:hypothetical protein XM38_038460 [Halomicronema hongdechloris C2206]